jgi:hypothetical protein
MTSFSLGRNPASRAIAVQALANTSATAGGSGDATAANGPAINLLTINGNAGRAESILLGIVTTNTINTGETCTYVTKLQQSVDGSSNWTDVGGSALTTTVSGALTGGVVLIERDFDLTKTSQLFVRLVVTPDLSRANTDTCSFHAVAFMAGLKRNQ